jgi:uracil-DNA glycosylase
MHPPVVVGRPVASRIILVGQAPGDKEPVLGRPFAWTAGRTLFKWFHAALGWSEEKTRDRVYFAAVCRCFPGKKGGGGDRVPDEDEIAHCASWLKREFALLRPALVLPVGKLAIRQFLGERPLAPHGTGSDSAASGDDAGRGAPGCPERWKRIACVFRSVPLSHRAS